MAGCSANKIFGCKTGAVYEYVLRYESFEENTQYLTFILGEGYETFLGKMPNMKHLTQICEGCET